MSTEDLSESLAAELTGSTGMPEQPHDSELPESLADDLADHEQYQAERDIPVSDDVQDTAQGELDRESEQEQSQQRGRKVPLAALHEERTKRQELQMALLAQQQHVQQLQAQQQAIQQAQLQAQQAAAEATIPEFSEDPEAWIKAKEAQINARFEQLQNGPAQQQQQVQAIEQQVMQEAAVLAPVLGEIEGRFTETTPDYPQAFDHVMATVEQNMRAQHPGINEQQLGMLRTAALVTLTKQCQSTGQDPAAYVYQRAQAMGFKPAQQAPRKQPNTSLSTLAGSARAPDERGKLSASQVSEMNEAEFDQLWKDMARDGVQRLKY